MSLDSITQSLIELVGIPSTSGHEEYVRTYLERRLSSLGIATQVDAAGNLIASLPGEGKPLMLNAHMDRVPPGRGHQPVIRGGIMYSDGSTNLGADDAAGIAIVLDILTQIVTRAQPHPPIVAVFTVQEEVGLVGASAFDPSSFLATAWGGLDGIVFDNAFEPGAVVSRGATYIAFDVEIRGQTGHPGKDLSETVNVIDIFRDARYPHGSLADDQTRILVSRIDAGSARNAIPAIAHIEGELRSFESPEIRQRYQQAISSAFEQAAQQHGGSATVTFDPHCTSYNVDVDEPLLALYREALAGRGESLYMHPTFIGSDTSAFRPRIKTFTISTGVVNEHSAQEYVALAPLEQIAQDSLWVIDRWR
ncbi:MAG TPA: M20/M25/M40 family metallo-hydrolase [Ktedonobacteraceae bacterium]|nr:M20/M25/M40 family metallo-hydrolase [Ktedonobacteraceae bacterium]